jgi:nucleoside 2-deoxyribosyltransferase
LRNRTTQKTIYLVIDKFGSIRETEEIDEMSKKIYWANALFSEADRKFNEVSVAAVRAAGYSVFLPQEAFSENADPTNEEIFRVDTTELQSCDIVVACLDQFPIDTGVACEIGVAYASGIPVVGLYTDIRSRRTGAGRMYKNQYVLGAIEARGEVVFSLGQLIETLPEYL